MTKQQLIHSGLAFVAWNGGTLRSAMWWTVDNILLYGDFDEYLQTNRLLPEVLATLPLPPVCPPESIKPNLKPIE